MTLRSDTSLMPMAGFAAASVAWHAGQGTKSPFSPPATGGNNGGKTRGWSDAARYRAALAQGHRWHGEVPEAAKANAKTPQGELSAGSAPGIAAKIADGLRSAGLPHLAQRYLDPQSPGDVMASAAIHAAGKAIESGVRAVTAPVRAWKGEIAPEAMIEEGRNVAGFAVTGGFAMPKPQATVGIFGGRLAKTANHAGLAKAERMAAEGAPRETIWSETGWFQGVDKKWRFEIDDSQAQLTKTLDDVARFQYPLPASAAYRHDDLYAAYPGASGTKLVPSKEYRPGEGAFGVISRDSPAYAGKDAIMLGHDPKKPFSSDRGAVHVLPHEFQHWTQKAEGFATGGSPREFEARPGQIADDLLSFQRRIAHDTYTRLAGEVEARAVEKRMDLSADQRRARPPWLDYDVAENQQIVRFDSKVAEARPRVLSPDEEAGLVAGKRSGTSNPALADIHGIDERTVQRILRRNGIEPGRPGRPRSFDLQGLAAAHAQGIPPAVLAVRYGVKLTTIERRLRAIATRPRSAAKQAAE